MRGRSRPGGPGARNDGCAGQATPQRQLAAWGRTDVGMDDGWAPRIRRNRPGGTPGTSAGPCRSCEYREATGLGPGALRSRGVIHSLSREPMPSSPRQAVDNSGSTIRRGCSRAHGTGASSGRSNEEPEEQSHPAGRDPRPLATGGRDPSAQPRIFTAETAPCLVLATDGRDPSARPDPSPPLPRLWQLQTQATRPNRAARRLT